MKGLKTVQRDTAYDVKNHENLAKQKNLRRGGKVRSQGTEGQ